MEYDKIKGLNKKISKLILGNDNQTNYESASKLWDHWITVGGNSFDNAHIYGGGIMEKLFGQWHMKRKNRNDLVIIAKGAHTPNCNPQSLSDQLNESLERMQIDHADIYIMHRDNKSIPVDEFIDVLNTEKQKGRIKIFGVSNWTLERFSGANNWAKKNKKYSMSILNNNLALSKMIKPLWPGCISSNDIDILNFLESTQTAHLSWSSQGRGYFLPSNVCKAIEKQITKDESSWRKDGEHSSGPISCFDSKDNKERRKRANILAAEMKVTTQNIAGCWPLNQPFPSFALIGPRKIEEIDSSLKNLDIKLTKDKVNWLNLVNE